MLDIEWYGIYTLPNGELPRADLAPKITELEARQQFLLQSLGGTSLVGGAQEDSDCILHPSWQAIFEKKAAELLDKLQ